MRAKHNYLTINGILSLVLLAICLSACNKTKNSTYGLANTVPLPVGTETVSSTPNTIKNDLKYNETIAHTHEHGVSHSHNHNEEAYKNEFEKAPILKRQKVASTSHHTSGKSKENTKAKRTIYKYKHEKKPVYEDVNFTITIDWDTIPIFKKGDVFKSIEVANYKSEIKVLPTLNEKEKLMIITSYEDDLKEGFLRTLDALVRDFPEYEIDIIQYDIEPRKTLVFNKMNNLNYDTYTSNVSLLDTLNITYLPAIFLLDGSNVVKQVESGYMHYLDFQKMLN